MSIDIRIGLVGFGEVGQILAGDLARAGVRQLIAWDVLFTDGSSIPSQALRSNEVSAAADAPSAVRGAQLVISAVTAAQGADAACSAVPGLERGAFYLDLNSVSPEMKQEVARIVAASGARYVEAAVMSPIGPKRIASPILLGGPHAVEFLEFGRLLGFTGARVFSHEVGKASAAKMCRSVMVKGMEALVTESLLTARRHGVEATVLASLQDLFPAADWRKLAQYMISRSLIHGRRRAEEMREVAQTVNNVGLAPHMSAACAARQDWAAQFRSFADAATLESMLDSILKALPPSCPSAGHDARVLRAHGSAEAAPAAAGEGTRAGQSR